jgi:LacI family transcriptional regulator
MIAPTSQKVLREKTRGIMRYARLHGPWEIQFLDDTPFVAKLGTLRSWRPDGIITRASPRDLAARVKGAAQIPTVFFDAELAATARCAAVHHDVRPAGAAVADAFLQQGLRHFAYVAPALEPQPFWSLERGESFAACLRRQGFECAFYRPRNARDWGLEQRHLRDWLRALPKPCGLLAAFDPLAKQVLDTCLAAEIPVPQEIAVMGVDDDETICENTVPTLSSVQSDFEGGAYQAAGLLDALMRRKIRLPTALTYGFTRIVPRQSTQFTPQMNRLVSGAREFIRLNACEGIGVADVASNLRVSRSHIEKQFKKTLGRSILDEIQAQRLERLCALLRETSLPIGEIGARCGYATETYLKRLFKRRFGLTMRAYRNKA